MGDLEGAARQDWITSCLLDVCFAGANFEREDVVIEEQMAVRANSSRSEKCACSSFGKRAPTSVQTPTRKLAPTPSTSTTTTTTLTTPTTTTTSTTLPRRQTCLIFGDPHVVTFDAAEEAMASRDVDHNVLWSAKRVVDITEKKCRKFCGAHWIVRSEEIKIQASYTDTRSWVKNIAISGSFLQGHTLIVSADGTVTWNDRQVVSTLPATFDNELVHLRYFHQNVYQDRWRKTRREVMRITLPQHVLMTVVFPSVIFGERGVGAFFTLSPPPGLDGHCGKADGNIADDNTKWFKQHWSRWQVSAEDSLFSNQLLLASEAAQLVAGGEESEPECLNGTRDEAWSLCRGALPDEVSIDWVTACCVMYVLVGLR